MRHFLSLVTLLMLFVGASVQAEPWFGRVLITNDDGIDNPRLKVLAQAFSEVADVVVLAPLTNCSGSTNYISAFQRKESALEKRDWGEGITVWAVDGFPGDCVMLALTGLMIDNPPDLVVSGVNSGPNLSDAYLASGTIGAARIAAQLGVPAIAFSNLKVDNASMMAAVPQWCVQLALEPFTRDLEPGEYLTVNFPNGKASEVKGACWAGLGEQVFHSAFDSVGEDEQGRNIWRNRYWFDEGDNQPAAGDVARHGDGWITISPMRLGDLDEARLGGAGELPGWPDARPQTEGE